ncbi:hypothetical protein [Dyella caseinilytica]|uniref:Uncharacterized protein n=1 Tax=Dyella caseinilytica TaxID=1849581 RepID=A0ABX7GXL7_9GAMM|nr:hypothetical protein [Dyella caseinilytica]QRN55237.1 hypothetical protein ISN74_07880 [Dyella caseinilytica]GGA00329.1 hypothetical protein GCM10011408_21540 [Dyella caseinilytica]
MNAKAEKIARILGKTTFKDFRQGFSTRLALDADSDADIKHALGVSQRMTGAMAVYALETHYASTLLHEHHLRRAWDALRGEPKRSSDYPIRRLGCSLAIREHAGLKLSQKELKEWAWILHTNYEAIETSVRASGTWLDDITGRATVAFINAMKEQREKRD